MADFEFCDMVIDKMAAHTIFARGVGNQKHAPHYSDQLISLDIDSADVLQMRLTAALGNRSHGVQMSIEKTDPASFFHKASSIMDCKEAEFLGASKKFADALTDAQTNPRWPGGVLIVISGKVGAPSKPFVAIIKAETDKGFSVVEEQGKISLQLVKKMLLSETQRLYKVGMLIERAAVKPDHGGLYDPQYYHAFLFDHLLTGNEVGKAAAYFYSTFLGLTISSSTRHQTRVFYDETIKFINSSKASDEEQYNYREALRAELKSNIATLNLEDFAKRTFPEELQAPYVAQVRKHGFPGHAIVKDTDYVKNKLRRPRNVFFTSGVQIKVPADQEFKDLVVINAASDGFTQVRITGAVENHE
jgi:hypothetical protein